MSVCRFCGKRVDEGVRYAARHVAHFRCYLAAGKGIDRLTAWQVGRFPARLIAEFGLINEANAKLARQAEADARYAAAQAEAKSDG
jgi:hypothetical protein